jgi:YHS domain-containing protein
MKVLMMWLACMAVFTTVSAQNNEIYSTGNVAINGYDAVAYFTSSKAVKGSEIYKHQWKGTTWLFSTSQNAEKFKADPEKYAPQYGGYCAYGCSKGYKAKTEGDAWSIVDGKLYLNYNRDVRDIWNKDQTGFIRKADQNWPKVKSTKF